jgi:hypothetical protein
MMVRPDSLRQSLPDAPSTDERIVSWFFRVRV